MTLTIQKYKLILASNSPRRRYLLRRAGIEFDVIPSHFDESRVDFQAGEIAALHPDCWIIGADTIVVIHGKVLGKPKDRSAARAMLEELSGQTHQVYTGFTICCEELRRRLTEVVATDVTFKKLTNDEIKWYIHTDEPFDKAGAYAIQGLGTFLVERINGSYTNVVGLPVCEVIGHLIREGVIRMQGNP